MSTEKKPDQGTQAKRQRALLLYLGVLFFAAFALVLLSFFAQLRDNRTTISQLAQTSTSALSNAQRLQEDNNALHAQVDELTAQMEAERENHEKALQALSDELAAAENRVANLEKSSSDQQAAFNQQSEELAKQNQQTLDKLNAYLLLSRAQTETDPEARQALLQQLSDMEKLLDEHAMVLLQQLKNSGAEEPDAETSEPTE